MANSKPATILLISMILLATGSIAGPREIAEELLLYLKTDESLNNLAVSQSESKTKTLKDHIKIDFGFTTPKEVDDKYKKCIKYELSWSGMREKILDVYTTHFTDKELQVLLDYYQQKGLPPENIEYIVSIKEKSNDTQKALDEDIIKAMYYCANIYEEYLKQQQEP